jgi:hypothetical protein
VLTVSDSAAIFPDRMIDHFVTQATETNLATGFTLTETDHFTVVTAPDGQTKSVGVSGTFGMPVESSLWSMPVSWWSQAQARS